MACVAGIQPPGPKALPPVGALVVVAVAPPSLNPVPPNVPVLAAVVVVAATIQTKSSLNSVFYYFALRHCGPVETMFIP